MRYRGRGANSGKFSPDFSTVFLAAPRAYDPTEIVFLLVVSLWRPFPKTDREPGKSRKPFCVTPTFLSTRNYVSSFTWKNSLTFSSCLDRA